MQIKEAIKNIELFKGLKNDEIAKIIDISDIREFKKDTIVYYEDDRDYSLQVLIKGRVKLYKIDKNNNEIYLYNIYENNLISQLTCIEKDYIHCFSNAQFTEDSLLLSINFKKFLEYFIYTNILTFELLKIVLKNNKKLHFILNRELVFDSIAKVAYMISNELEIFNKLKRKEIALKLHIQPETLSRVINKLRENNIIQLNQSNKIEIIDDLALENYFYGIAK